jgi:hypothetical protein
MTQPKTASWNSQKLKRVPDPTTACARQPDQNVLAVLRLTQTFSSSTALLSSSLPLSHTPTHHCTHTAPGIAAHALTPLPLAA